MLQNLSRYKNQHLECNIEHVVKYFNTKHFPEELYEKHTL